MPKPTPKYQKQVDWCAKDGDGSDLELNTVKNRIDRPKKVGDYHQVKFEEVRDLTYEEGQSGDRTKEIHGQKKDLTSIYKYEGLPIRLQGYLLYVKDGKKMVGGIQEGKEACNCHEKIFDHVDYHLWLVKDFKDSFSDAAVVEMTPRMRAVHKGRWIKQEFLESDLNFLAAQHIPVRVYGWLLFDGEHVGQLPGHSTNVRRHTLWELHPITRIDSFQNGKWAELR